MAKAKTEETPAAASAPASTPVEGMPVDLYLEGKDAPTPGVIERVWRPELVRVRYKNAETQSDDPEAMPDWVDNVAFGAAVAGRPHWCAPRG